MFGALPQLMCRHISAQWIYKTSASLIIRFDFLPLADASALSAASMSQSNLQPIAVCVIIPFALSPYNF